MHKEKDHNPSLVNDVIHKFQANGLTFNSVEPDSSFNSSDYEGEEEGDGHGLDEAEAQINAAQESVHHLTRSVFGFLKEVQDGTIEVRRVAPPRRQ